MLCRADSAPYLSTHYHRPGDAISRRSADNSPPHLVGSGDDSFPRAGGGVAAMGVPSAMATVGPKVK